MLCKAIGAWNLAMAMCNYEIKITVRFKYKTGILYEKVMAVLDYLGGQFFKNLRDFWLRRFQILNFEYEDGILKGQVIRRRLKNISFDYLEEFVRSFVGSRIVEIGRKIERP